jgi:hypothetical protein
VTNPFDLISPVSNAWNPGAKPVGPLKLKKLHPGVKGLIFALVVKDGRFYDLLSGEVGAVTGNPTFGIGPGGPGMQFDGNDLFSFPDISALGTKFNSFDKAIGWSVALGLSFTTTSNTVIAEKSTNRTLTLQTSGSAVSWRTEGPGSVATKSSIINDGKPHNLVCTAKDAGTNLTHHRIFLDGAKDADATEAYEMPVPNTSDFVIGARSGGSVGFLGDLYHFFVWDYELVDTLGTRLSKKPYEIIEADTAQIYNFPSVAAVTSVTTGTAVPTQTEAEVVTGGKTIILTLTGDAWVAAGTGPIGSTADTQAIIDGLTAATTPTFGWNNEVRDKEVTTAVVRTSSTVCTITLTAAAAYDISSTETITPTIPAVALVTSADPVVSSPTFTVTAVAAAGGLSSSLMMLGVGF